MVVVVAAEAEAGGRKKRPINQNNNNNNNQNKMRERSHQTEGRVQMLDLSGALSSKHKLVASLREPGRVQVGKPSWVSSLEGR